MNRLDNLIDQLPRSSYNEIATPQQVRGILDRGHIHPLRPFASINWQSYHIVDADNVQHKVQLIFLGLGDRRNSLYCITCKGLCPATVTAMIHFLSTSKPLTQAETCQGCGKVL